MGRAGEQRGQTAAEILGVLLVVSFVIAALFVSDAPAAIASTTKQLICKIGGGTCATDKPPLCVVSSDTRAGGGEVFVNARYVKVTVDAGGEITVAERADGSYAITLKLKAGAKVGPGLKADLKAKGIDIDAGARLGGDAAITYRADNKAQADRFLKQLNEANRKDKLGMLCLICRLRPGGPFRTEVDYPPVESYTVNGDTTVNVGASGSVQGPYATPPGKGKKGEKGEQGEDEEPDVTDTRATGEAGVEIKNALGATYTASGENKGDRTVYYEVSGSGELKGDAVIGPLVNAALGGKLTGKARVAVTVDKNGSPKSLRITHTVEGEVAVGVKNSRSTTFGDLASNTPFYARDTGAAKGKGLEVTTTVDLTDERLRDATRKAFTGRDPNTGQPVDRTDAAAELGRAASNATNFTARTYDYDKRSDRHDVDLVVVGGAGTEDTSHQRTTGFGTYDPETGRFTWTNGCPK